MTQNKELERKLVFFNEIVDEYSKEIEKEYNNKATKKYKNLHKVNLIFNENKKASEKFNIEEKYKIKVGKNINPTTYKVYKTPKRYGLYINGEIKTYYEHKDLKFILGNIQKELNLFKSYNSNLTIKANNVELLSKIKLL